MSKLRSSVAGLVAVAAGMTFSSAFADVQKWFHEDTNSVTAALAASTVGQSADGMWAMSNTTESVAGSLYVNDETGKVCVDTDLDNYVSYKPNLKVNGNKATVVISNICFNAAVDLSGVSLEGVQAAVAIVQDGDSYYFRVAGYDNDISEENWFAPEWDSANPNSAYNIICTFDYSAWTVKYTLGNTDSEAYGLPPVKEGEDGKVSKAEFSGTCSFTSFSGEKQPVQFTLTLPPVAGIESYTIGGTTQASGDWALTEGSTPTVTITLAPGYFAKGTTATLPAITENTSYTADQVTAMLELVQGEAKIGETYYRTLQAAADAVKDTETIVIQKDYTTTESVMFTNKTDVILDLNGKKVEYTDKTYALRFFDTTITLTSSVDGGIYKKTGAGTLALVGSREASKADHGSKISTATVTIAGGTWYCETTSGSCFKIENGSAELNGGIVEHSVQTENEDQVAFAVCTNQTGAAQTLTLNAGMIKGYVECGAGVTLAYDNNRTTKFSIQQNDICADGYEMVKGEDNFYTIQVKQTPTTFKMTLTLGANVSQVAYTISGSDVTNEVTETTGNIEVANGVTVEITGVTYALGYKPADGDKKGSSRKVESANIEFTFAAQAMGGELPPDVKPADFGITNGAFAVATSNELVKVNNWATKTGTSIKTINEMTFGDTLTTTEQSYLLNCSESQLDNEKAAFKIESITFDENGKPVIPDSVTGKTYNGKIQKQSRAKLAEGEWGEFSDAHKFFRFKLVK